jgi:seryl-tRNA synthetase
MLVGCICVRQTAAAWAAFHVPSARTVASRASLGLRAAASTSTESVSMTVHGRLSRADLSLDLKTIATNLEVVVSHLKSRRASLETIAASESIAASAERRVQLIQERDAALNQRKELSAVVGKLMRIKDTLDAAQREELDTAIERSNEAAAAADKAEEELAVIQQEMDRQLAGIPNLLDDRVPDGKDDSENEQVYKWGDVTALPAKLGWADDFTPAWHDDIAVKLEGYKAEAAVQMSGARFVALQGNVARLERALAMFFVDLHSQQHGYTEVSVPYVVSRSALEGTGQLPKFEEDLFAIKQESHTCNGEDAFLIPTAEVPVTNLHRDQVLEEDDLPLSYVAWTPCFRAEAGSYGRDTKGLIRTHQFQKVELVKITTADTSDAQHEELTGHAEACLRALELPYRKVRLCSGDTGFSARHCYDLEVWLPGASEYREISSCSNTGDFQARRMALRYRPKAADGSKKKSKPVLCHTINGSGLAVGRTLVAVLENYQKPDGSVVVPEVLRPYMGGKEILEPPLPRK